MQDVRGAVALALQDKDSGSATFDCDSIRKDLRTMVAEAKSRGFAVPLAGLAVLAAVALGLEIRSGRRRGASSLRIGG